MKTYYYPAKLLLLLLTLTLPVNSHGNETSSIDSGGMLSSAQLVAAVLQANPELEVAQASWQASLARIKQQSAFDDPQFQYSFAPFTIDSQKTDFGQRFEISQKIPFPGKLSVRGKAAKYQAEAKQLDITTLQLLLATQAKQLFADWYFIHRAIDINKTNQNLLAEFRDIALTRYSTGLASKQDVLRAEVEQALLKHQSIVHQRNRKTILAKMNTLLNSSFDKPLPVPLKLPVISELPNLHQLQIRAKHSRPELKAITTSINTHRARMELAQLAYYPDLKLTAGYNSLWDNEDKRLNIGVGISLPLDQSKRRAAEQQAKASHQQAHWQKIDLETQISEELAVAHAYLEESLHVLQLYRQHLAPLADDHLAAAKADYMAGKGDFLTLISSEKNALQTKLQTQQALADVHRRYAALERAVGSLELSSTGSDSL